MDFSVALDILGYSRYNREIVRTTHLIVQYLEDTCMGNKAITSGGMAECSCIPGSDTDVMEVVNLFKVMEKNKSNAHSTGTTQLQKRIPVYISRKCCHEGYCRLECSTLYINAIKLALFAWDSRGIIEPYEKVSSIVYKTLLSITHEYNGRYYISSELFHDNIISSAFVHPNGPHCISNGPAMTCENVDAVQCLQLIQWPTEAKTWSSRERQNNWPNKELLSHLENNVSCYVVPIGSKSSKESDLEWRISFVEIERNLIWNMNDTQFKCFVLLKALKREYMEHKISTYHIKNVAFWLCEELPETVWEKDLLVTCVKTGLKRLQQYVKEGYLPHYIVPNNNLFHNKIIRQPGEKKQVLKLLDGICNELEDKLLLLKSFGITYYMQDMYENVVLSPECSSNLQSLVMVGEYCKRCQHVLLTVRLRNSQSLCVNMVKTFGEDCEDILPCIRIALIKLKLRKRSRTDNEIDEFIVKMKKENKIDDLTVALTCGMIYFMHSRYFDVRNTLIQKLKDGSNKIYMTYYGENVYMCLKSGNITHIETVTTKQVEDIRTHRHNFVMDFPVGYHELEYLPFPIKLQLCLCSQTLFIRCNPLVLSCYMMYISEYNLDLGEEMGKTRVVFENVVSKDTLNRFNYIHLNLLGHSLYVTGDRKSAFRCFVMSTMVFPSSNNGALYHIACMINDIVQKKCAPVGN